jgi:hypothetical protein
MTVSAPITTPFTAESTAAEVVDGIDLTGRPAGERIAAEIARAGTTGRRQVLVARLDLAGQASVAGTCYPRSCSRTSTSSSGFTSRARGPRRQVLLDDHLVHVVGLRQHAEVQHEAG